METDRPFLFTDDALPWQPAYDVASVRERLDTALVKMRAAASWPSKDSTVFHYRETVWPSLLKKLPDAAEAARLRSEMEAEIGRLDAVV
ncbi:MAG TPA: hypothetical protein VIY09_02750 [Rhizomicrobium sp.]